MSLLKFYKNKLKANEKDDYYFENILKWSDYKLEIEHDYISWLFPDETGGVNHLAPKLTLKEVEIFKKNQELRENVIRASLRMLTFYGFEIKNKKLKQIKKIDRFEFGKNGEKTQVGFYKNHNFRRLTRIMKFLYTIEMKELSSYYFLMICKVMKRDPYVYDQIVRNGSLKFFIKTQKYLKKYDFNFILKSLNENRTNRMNEKDNKLQMMCENKISGLNYTGNSCYQDTSLLCLFSRKNEFIDDNILYKDLNEIESKEVKCSIKTREKIQKELYRITKSMRGLENISYCSNLRKLLKDCDYGSKFSTTDMQDAGEFLQYLFSLFEVVNTKIKILNYVTNSKEEINNDNILDSRKLLTKTLKRTEVVSPVFNVSNFILEEQMKFSDIMINMEDVKFTKENRYNFEDKKYSRKITITKILESDYIIFNIMRKFYNISKGKNDRNYDYIDFERKLRIGNNILFLNSIVIHESHHYTCYFRCGNEWFFYNDNPSGSKHLIKRVGKFTDLINIEDTHRLGTLYFYNKDM